MLIGLWLLALIIANDEDLYYTFIEIGLLLLLIILLHMSASVKINQFHMRLSAMFLVNAGAGQVMERLQMNPQYSYSMLVAAMESHDMNPQSS